MHRAAVRILLMLALTASSGLVPAATLAHEAPYPIVLIHGWTSDGDTFRELIPKLTAQGFRVLDFDTATPGIQAMTYAPTAAGQHIPYIAAKIVEEKIKAALAANGYDPNTQKIDIIGHSMGGLVARFLVEQGGADVDYWSDTTGWYGDGIPDLDTSWRSRVDDLIIAGTPNRGTWPAWIPTLVGGFGIWNAAATDMRPGSRFLQRMGYAAPAGKHYTTLGGDPWYLRWFRSDLDGDGVARGFDGIVPAESPFLAGADNNVFDANHHELITADAPVDLIINALGYTSSQTGTGRAYLAGDAFVRLEYFSVVQDHDGGTTDEFRFDIFVDPDGNNDGYTYLQTLSYDRDAPFTQNWGNAGPATVTIPLPGTSPRMDVKVVVWESDPFGAREPVSTHSFTDILQSEDIDGQDYYEKAAPDAKGGTNVMRISVNGVTARIGKTRLVTFGFDKAFIADNHDCCGTNGEVQFTLLAGRAGYQTTVYRGDPGSGTHYSRADGTWVDIGVHAKNNGVVESETILRLRMLTSATARFDLQYWEDDGGWSSRDGGATYTTQLPVSAIPSGRTNYSGTAHADWDGYWYLVADA